MTTSPHGASARAGRPAKTDRPRKPGKIQPILVDRLAKALAAHGVSLKRTEILGVAAAAFGYHNANEFAAAGLTAPAARAIGRTSLPTGEDLVVIHDPLARAPYGIDARFVEHGVGERRAELLGVSPYGHVLDLSGLPDQALDTLPMARQGQGGPLHIAIVEHKHGTSGYVAATKDDLYAQVAGFLPGVLARGRTPRGPDHGL